MLTQLAIFNSQKHAKVIIDFKDATAIQIIGENKIGKTTLIDTLNFLYIIDPQKMSFDNKKYTFKESVNHFFPTHNRSYIVFECFKARAGGYFCILVKRKGAGDNVEYFKIDKKFDEKDYLEESGELRKFEDIRKDFNADNSIEGFKDKNSLFQYVYNKNFTHNAFVWIDKKVKRQGQALENSLSRVYLFLLNASLIDDTSLREALIIADNKQNEALNVFADRTKIEAVEKLKNQGEYIKKLKVIKDEVDRFRFLVNQYDKLKKEQGELFYSLQHYLSEELKRLKSEVDQNKELVETYNQEKKLVEENKSKLTETVGRLKAEMRFLRHPGPGKEGRIDELENEIAKINYLLNNVSPVHNTVEEVSNFLENELKTLTKQYDEVSASLQSITQYQTTESETQRKLSSLKRNKELLSNKIEQYQNLLVHNISEDEKVRKFFNTIFSEEITSKFTKDDLIEKVSSISDILELNDGKIKGFENLELKEMASVKILKEDLSALEKDLVHQEDILATIKNREAKEKQRAKLKNDIREHELNIKKIKDKPRLDLELSKAQKEWDTLNEEMQLKNEELLIVNAEYAKLVAYIKEKESVNRKNEFQIAKYEEWHREYQYEIIEKVENLLEGFTIEELYQKLKKKKQEVEKAFYNKASKFEDLKIKTDKTEADEKAFIESINQEINSIADLEVGLKTLLEQTSNNFTQPVADFLQRYKEFKVFINSFNRRISDYKISDLKALKIQLKDNGSLISDLEKISKIIRVDDFQPDIFNQIFSNKEQQEYLGVLKEYTEIRNKPIAFKELFDVTLVAEDSNNNAKKIDLRKGNESTGTIRMINLILFLLVIKFFKVDDRENKLVFFVDEDVIDTTNTAQLVKFCRENGFIIIFAAKHQIVGLEKYYFMKKSTALGNKVFADERNVIYAKKKEIATTES